MERNGLINTVRKNIPRAWNMHAGIKTQSINIVALAASGERILNCENFPNISSQRHKRTEFQPVNLMESKTGSHMLVTAHINFMQLRLRIYLALSNISIALPWGNHIEGAHIYAGRNLCTTFSFNTCMYKENSQYGKVLLLLNVLENKNFQPLLWLVYIKDSHSFL